MKGKTAKDKQTAKLIARISENLPSDMDENVMQGWIDNPKGLQQAFREALCPPRFREKDGVIYLTVTSDGTTGEDWIKILGEDNLSKYAKDVLRSKDFQPTTGVVYEIAILKGMLFNDSDRITSKIRANAEGCGWTKPNAEVACLIRKKFSNEEIEAMGLTWIITMHEPIKDSGGDPSLLVPAVSMVAVGCTRTTTAPASGGVVITGSPSSSRKSSPLRPKSFGPLSSELSP